MLKQLLSLSTVCLLTFGFAACSTDEPEVKTDEVTGNTTPSNPEDPAENPATGVLTLKIKDAGNKDLDVYAAEETVNYPVTVMKEGASANPVKVTLKILNDEEFKHFRDITFGDPNFPGLQPLRSELYTLNSADEANSVNHTFASSDNDYFVGNLTIDAGRLADWRTDLESRTTEKFQQKYPEEYKLAMDTLNNFHFVIPVGIFSETDDDAIPAAGRYLMLSPRAVEALISISVGNDEALIVDQPRSLLLDQTSNFRQGSFGQELVKFSLPCANPYGFQIKFNNNPDVDIARFNGHHVDMSLTKLERKDIKGNYNYTLANNKSQDYIDFPAGKTEVWLPIEFSRTQIDYTDTQHFYATSIQLAGFDWRDSPAPDVVKGHIKLPTSDITWIPTGAADDGKYNGYTFFIGYRVVDR